VRALRTEQTPRLRTEVMSTRDFYSDRQWHSTGMYTDVLRPAGVEHELVTPLAAVARAFPDTTWV
jgi:hypothetical protein